MIPVNVRTEEQRGTMGNRVSMMLPQIPVGIADPITRLNAIRTEMDALKSSDQGAAFDRLLGLVENGPAAFSAIAGRVGLLPGMINLACTNVPGPSDPAVRQRAIACMICFRFFRSPATWAWAWRS